MAQGTLFPSPWFTAIDNTGKIINGAKCFFYIAGTSTLQNTFSDVGLTVANANPVIADSAGRVGPVFFTPGASYKLIYQDASGTVLRTQDNILAVPPSASTLDITGTAGQGLTAGQVVYLSDGSAGLNPGQWYPADSANLYSSTANWIGMVPSAITSGSTGTVRLAGSLTGLSGLTAGTLYYVGAAGALTSAAPANKRLVGQADTATSLVVTADPPIGLLLDNGINDFRLTLTTGVPVTIADVTAATTIYCTPYRGNRIVLFDASGNPTLFTSSELSIAVPATTNQAYDIWAYNNAGVVALELLAWTNDTTRATALVNTVAVGIYTKSGDSTRRYVGSFRTTGVSGQTEDSAKKRYLQSYANRVQKPVNAFDPAASWTNNSPTWRQANANTANQIDLMNGLQETPLQVWLVATAQNSVGSVWFNIGIGEDSTTAPLANYTAAALQPAIANIAYQMTPPVLTKNPAIGRHFYTWLEAAQVGGSTTFYGTNTTVGGNTIISGLSGLWWC